MLFAVRPMSINIPAHLRIPVRPKRSSRSLPQETRAYARVMTGRSVDEWTTGSQPRPVAMPAVAVPCDLPASEWIQPSAEAAQPKAETVKPRGVEIVGGTTPANALARYRDWQPKFAALVAGREPHVVLSVSPAPHGYGSGTTRGPKNYAPRSRRPAPIVT